MARFLKTELMQLRRPWSRLGTLAAGFVVANFSLTNVVEAQQMGNAPTATANRSTSALDNLFDSSEIDFAPMPSMHGKPVAKVSEPAAAKNEASSYSTRAQVPILSQPSQPLFASSNERVDSYLGHQESEQNTSRSNSAKMLLPVQRTSLSEPQSNQGPTSQWNPPRLPQPPSRSGVDATRNQRETKTPAADSFPAAQVSFQEPVDYSQTERSGFPPSNVASSRNQARVSQFQPTQIDQPAVRQAMVLSQVAGQHQLRNINSNQFESALMTTWGTDIQSASSPDGRYLRVGLPNRTGRTMAMLIDRQNHVLTYEGEPALQSSWQELVQRLDYQPVRRADGSAVHTAVVNPGRAQLRTVQQATFLMGMLQDNSAPQLGQEQVTMPAGSPMPQAQEIMPGGPGAAQGIKNKVKILQDPNTGMITLIGEKEDLEIVRKIIMEIAARSDASQPEVSRIPLRNIQSEAVAEQIQEMYDAGYAPSKGSVTVTPVPSPNSLVVIGQPEAIEAVRKIVAQMDVESDETLDGFKSFRLQYISAADAKIRLDTFFGQSGQGGGDNRIPSAPVVTISDYRSNIIIVKGSRQFIVDAERLLNEIDVDHTGAVNLVKVIPLKNTLAEELAVVIQDAINGQLPNAGNGYKGANQQQQQQQQNNVNANQSQITAKSLTIKTIGQDGQLLTSTSGILFDVRVTADRNSNSLVVSAPIESMALIEALVAQLDRIPNAETQIKVFQIYNGDATTLLTTLQSMFQSSTTQGQQGGQGGGQTAAGGNLSQLPLQSASATDGATLLNLRFSVDTRTNSIIAAGPAGDLQVIEDLLVRLDENQMNERASVVYRLSNAPVLDVAEAVNAWLTTRATINAEDPRAVGGLNQTNREVIVVPEVVSNSLIISARPEYMSEIASIIQALDRRPPMVKVKVMIAEVDLNRLEEFGMDLGVQDSLMFDRGTSIGAGNAITGIGFPFNTSTAPNRNATFRETLAGQALSNLGTGRINNDLGYGGLVLSAGNESISILMRALKDKQCVRVLSKPQIVTMENLQGRVKVGASVPRISGTTNSNFGITQNIEFVDVGVILEVTPRVSPDGMIVMAVVASKSSVGPDSTGITIAIGADGTPIRSPQIIETEARTTLMSRSGQTVVFAGLIQESKTHIVRGAPILSDLPLIGPLFRYERDQATRSELLIIMTPYLITDDEDIELQNNDEMDRMHWCLSDVAEVYGNTDYENFDGNQGAIQTYFPDSDPSGLQPQSYSGEISGRNQ